MAHTNPTTSSDMGQVARAIERMANVFQQGDAMNRQVVINQLNANALRVNQQAHPLEYVGLSNS